MAKKLPEPEILEDSIKINLGGEFWIKFTKSWGSTDSQKFRNVANDTVALKMVIEHTVDWNIPDSDWNPLPFDKEKLLAQLNAFAAGQVDEDTKALLSISQQLAALKVEHPELEDAIATVGGLAVQAKQITVRTRAILPEASSECFSIPTPLQVELSKAYYTAMGLSDKIPFGSLLPSSSPPKTTTIKTESNEPVAEG